MYFKCSNNCGVFNHFNFFFDAHSTAPISTTFHFSARIHQACWTLNSILLYQNVGLKCLVFCRARFCMQISVLSLKLHTVKSRHKNNVGANIKSVKFITHFTFSSIETLFTFHINSHTPIIMAIPQPANKTRNIPPTFCIVNSESFPPSSIEQSSSPIFFSFHHRSFNFRIVSSSFSFSTVSSMCDRYGESASEIN